MWREFTWGGHGTGHSEQRAEISRSEKRATDDVHGCSSLSSFLNSHLEVYIVRHTLRAGKKTRSILAQTPMCLFAVPMDARTCHFHRTVGYLENRCRKIRISRRMMMVIRRRMMMMLMIWGGARGGRGGSLSPGRSGIRGPTRPFASQSKTQGSPLGSYLSWLKTIFEYFKFYSAKNRLFLIIFSIF